MIGKRIEQPNGAKPGPSTTVNLEKGSEIAIAQHSASTVQA